MENCGYPVQIRSRISFYCDEMVTFADLYKWECIQHLLSTYSQIHAICE